jgi:ribonucleoside-diphosphate reductase alpha chain
MGRVHADLQRDHRRPPALMVTCGAEHPRIRQFINAKSDADFFAFFANISVKIDNARQWAELRGAIAEGAHRNGEPGVVFQDVADADNPTPEFKLRSTAPCAEAIMAENERCVFVTLNMAAHVVGKRFDMSAFISTTRLAVRAADAAVEIAAEGAAPIVGERRRIGIGVCGFHSALITMGVPYARSTWFAARVAETLLFTAHKTSMALAKTRGCFPAWDTSRWRDPEWLERKANRRAGAIPAHSWTRLHAEILRCGMRHATVVAFPPTGVVAEILGVSKSYEPHFTLVGRTRATSTRPVTVAPEVEAVIDATAGPGALNEILNPESLYQLPNAPTEHLLACARQLPADVHIAVHAAFTGIADEAGSKTVNLPREASVQEVEAVLDKARSLGLKGVTVFRDGCLDECVRPPEAAGQRVA